jgi:Leucine-rich repeat (LRR) protein
MPDICAEEYLVNFFETLYFRKLGIESIDPLLAKFNNLNILNLSFNKIQKIENLPKNIKELYLTGNVID